VYEVDKSKQTKTMNAYVTGIGPSARIVMWDTLLAKMNHDEVLGDGPRMGHYALKHMWKGIAFAIAVSLFVFVVGQKIIDRACRVSASPPPAIPALPWVPSSSAGSASSSRPPSRRTHDTENIRRTSSRSSSRI
jgi:Zn-dependent protease with chaperone function